MTVNAEVIFIIGMRESAECITGMHGRMPKVGGFTTKSNHGDPDLTKVTNH